MSTYRARLFAKLAATCLALSLLSSCGGNSKTAHSTKPSPSSAMETPVLPFGDAQIVEEKIINERLLELIVQTSSFTELTHVLVNLPRGYTTQKQWPVTLYLAGTSHTYKSFNEIYGGEELVADYPSIVVSPNGKSGYWSDWFNQGEGGPPRYETFLIKELLPIIEKRFSAIGLREGRAILGESMGGYGALMIATRHPDLFVAAASVSGTVNTNLPANAVVLSASPALDGAAPESIYGPRATEEVRWRGHNPFDLAQNLSEMVLWVGSANGVVLEPTIGETAVDQAGCGVEFGVYTASLTLHEQLNNLGIEHTWRDFGPGCHSVPNFRRQITEVLKLFSQTFEKREVIPSKVDHKAIEPSVSVWNWTIEADSSRALEFMTVSDASSSGITISGSGLTQVTSPPFFEGINEIALEGASPALVRPDDEGRIRFLVDLGQANSGQQFLPSSNTQVQTVTVNLRPLN